MPDKEKLCSFPGEVEKSDIVYYRAHYSYRNRRSFHKYVVLCLKLLSISFQNDSSNRTSEIQWAPGSTVFCFLPSMLLECGELSRNWSKPLSPTLRELAKDVKLMGKGTLILNTHIQPIHPWVVCVCTAWCEGNKLLSLKIMVTWHLAPQQNL